MTTLKTIHDLPLSRVRTLRDNYVETILKRVKVTAGEDECGEWDLPEDLEHICRADVNWKSRLVVLRAQLRREVIRDELDEDNPFDLLKECVERIVKLEREGVKR